MFTCISAKKQIAEEEREESQESGTTSSSNKSIASQIKDLALKISNSLHLKGCVGSSPTTEEQYPHMMNICPPQTPGQGFDLRDSRNPRRDDNASSTRDFFGFNLRSNDPSFHPAITSTNEIIEEEHNESMKWVAEVDEGVYMTFQTLPDGGNKLLQIRFGHENFGPRRAQKWWISNYDRIRELYNIRNVDENFNFTPPSTHHEIQEEYPREEAAPIPNLANAQDNPLSFRDWMQGGYSHGASSSSGVTNPAQLPPSFYQSDSIEFHAGPSSSSTQPTFANITAQDDEVEAEAEWTVQVAQGVEIKIRQLSDGTRVLCYVRFNPRQFTNEEAQRWWERNRERVHDRYV